MNSEFSLLSLGIVLGEGGKRTESGMHRSVFAKHAASRCDFIGRLGSVVSRIENIAQNIFSSRDKSDKKIYERL
jgi:hypothetical protein